MSKNQSDYSAKRKKTQQTKFHQIPKVFSTKSIRINKTEQEIIYLIRYEFGTFDSDLALLNKIINIISRFSIRDNPPTKGDKIYFSSSFI